METSIVKSRKEFEVLHIIRAILQDSVRPERILCGKAKSYIAVALDGKKTRPICRIYVKQQMYIGTISNRKVETKNKIHDTTDIFKFSEDLRATIKYYEEYSI